MPSQRGSDRNYWRAVGAKRKAIARYESGEPLTGADREDWEVLWANLVRDLMMARHHLRDGEYVHAMYDVIAAHERAEQLWMRGKQLELMFADEVVLPREQVAGDVYGHYAGGGVGDDDVSGVEDRPAAPADDLEFRGLGHEEEHASTPPARVEAE